MPLGSGRVENKRTNIKGPIVRVRLLVESRRITAIHVCQYSVSSNLWNKRPASFIDLTAHLQIVTWIRMRPGIGKSPWADGANIVLEVRLHFIRSLDFPRFSSIDESYLDRPKSQIQQHTCLISHNAPFRTGLCTFLFWMVYCGIRGRFVGFVRLVYCKTGKRFLSTDFLEEIHDVIPWHS